MSIYTRGGDAGDTSLLGKVRVPKDTLRIEVYGTLDEATSIMGMARATTRHDDICQDIIDLQGDLIDIMSELATPEASQDKVNILKVQPDQVKQLEQMIDRYEQERFPSHHFIRPGGSFASAILDQARTVARRAERRLITLNREEGLNPEIIKYLNRLSDLLYVMARVEEQREIKQVVVNQLNALTKEADPSPTPLPIGEGKLSLAECNRIIEAGIHKAQEIGVPMVLSVVDDSGQVIETRRMDNALVVSITLAPNKAFTAATVRLPTHELAQLAQPNEQFYSIEVNMPQLTLVGGGFPLWKGDQLMGAVGASGGLAEQDIAVAQAMVAAFDQIGGNKR